MPGLTKASFRCTVCGRITNLVDTAAHMMATNKAWAAVKTADNHKEPAAQQYPDVPIVQPGWARADN